MKRSIKFIFKKPLLLISLLLVGMLGIGGCFRGGWGHGYGGRHSVERMESHAADMREDLAEELELRPEQMPAYNVLMDEYQKTIFGWHGSWRARSTSLKVALDQDNPDMEAVRDILKGYVREKPSDEETDALIDKTVDFYIQLDAEQQEEIREHLVKKLRRRY